MTPTGFEPVKKGDSGAENGGGPQIGPQVCASTDAASASLHCGSQSPQLQASDEVELDLATRLSIAWSKLNMKERARITKLAEQISGTAKKPHASKLQPIQPGEGRMLPAANVAGELGISITRLRDWTKRGWIKGAEKIGGRIHYPPQAVIEAASQHLKRTKSPKGKIS